MYRFQLLSIIFLAWCAAAVPLGESRNITERTVDGNAGCGVHIKQSQRRDNCDFLQFTLAYGSTQDANAPTCKGQISDQHIVYCQGELHAPLVCTQGADTHTIKCCASHGGYCFGTDEIGGCSVGGWAYDDGSPYYGSFAGMPSRQMDCTFAC